MDLWTGLQTAVRKGIVARGASSAVATVAGRRVHFYELRGTGAGPPVVLLHGLASSGTSFSRVMFALAARFRRIYVPDLPGNGFSPLPETGALSLEEQVGVLQGFIREVVGQPVFLVGNSLGGAMALVLALRSPDLLVSLVLISPAGARPAPDRLEGLLKRLDVRDGAGAREITRRLFHRTPFLAWLFASQLRQVYGTAAVQSALAEVRGQDLFKLFRPKALAALRTPTLLLWGESEKLLPYEGIDYFREHLPPIAQVEVVKGFGHVPQLERPQEVVKRLVAYADAQQL